MLLVPAFTISAQNTFTPGKKARVGKVYLHIGGSGWTASVSVQVSHNGTDWYFVPDKVLGDSSTGKYTTAVGTVELSVNADMYFRVGVQTGDYTSGDVVITAFD